MSFFGFAENLVAQLENKAREVLEDPTFLRVVSDQASSPLASADSDSETAENETAENETAEPNPPSEELSAAELARESIKALSTPPPGQTVFSPANEEITRRREENKRLLQSLKRLKDKMIEMQAEAKLREEGEREVKEVLRQTEDRLQEVMEEMRAKEEGDGEALRRAREEMKAKEEDDGLALMQSKQRLQQVMEEMRAKEEQDGLALKLSKQRLQQVMEEMKAKEEEDEEVLRKVREEMQSKELAWKHAEQRLQEAVMAKEEDQTGQSLQVTTEKRRAKQEEDGLALKEAMEGMRRKEEETRQAEQRLQEVMDEMRATEEENRHQAEQRLQEAEEQSSKTSKLAETRFQEAADESQRKEQAAVEALRQSELRLSEMVEDSKLKRQEDKVQTEQKLAEALELNEGKEQKSREVFARIEKNLTKAMEESKSKEEEARKALADAELRAQIATEKLIEMQAERQNGDNSDKEIQEALAQAKQSVQKVLQLAAVESANMRLELEIDARVKVERAERKAVGKLTLELAQRNERELSKARNDMEHEIQIQVQRAEKVVQKRFEEELYSERSEKSSLLERIHALETSSLIQDAAKLTQYESERDVLKLELEKAHEKISKFDEKKKQVVEQLRGEKIEKAALADKVAELENVLKLREEDPSAKNLEDERDLLKAEVDKLNSGNDELSARLDELVGERHKFQSEITELQTKLAVMSSSASDESLILRGELEQARAELALALVADVQLATLNADIQLLNSRTDELLGENSALKQQLASVQDSKDPTEEIQRLQIQIVTMASENFTTQEDLSATLADYHELRDDSLATKTRLETDVLALKELLAEAQYRLAESKTGNDSLLDEFKTKFEKAEAELEVGIANNAENESMFDDLKQKLTKAESELSSALEGQGQDTTLVDELKAKLEKAEGELEVVLTARSESEVLVDEFKAKLQRAEFELEVALGARAVSESLVNDAHAKLAKTEDELANAIALNKNFEEDINAIECKAQGQVDNLKAELDDALATVTELESSKSALAGLAAAEAAMVEADLKLKFESIWASKLEVVKSGLASEIQIAMEERSRVEDALTASSQRVESLESEAYELKNLLSVVEAEKQSLTLTWSKSYEAEAHLKEKCAKTETDFEVYRKKAETALAKAVESSSVAANETAIEKEMVIQKLSQDLKSKILALDEEAKQVLSLSSSVVALKEALETNAATEHQKAADEWKRKVVLAEKEAHSYKERTETELMSFRQYVTELEAAASHVVVRDIERSNDATWKKDAETREGELRKQVETLQTKITEVKHRAKEAIREAVVSASRGNVGTSSKPGRARTSSLDSLEAGLNNTMDSMSDLMSVTSLNASVTTSVPLAASPLTRNAAPDGGGALRLLGTQMRQAVTDAYRTRDVSGLRRMRVVLFVVAYAVLLHLIALNLWLTC